MDRLVRRIGGFAKVQVARLRGRPVTDQYETRAPSPQHALDLFAGEWASRLPAPHDALDAGAMPLFADTRLLWALEHLGGVERTSILELGPLEGGHSWMLAQAGAASITAIEANRRAYLKCLVVKEVVGLERVRVLLGDFLAYLRAHPDAHFDVGIASGVLYHMAEPVELLARLARACDRLFLWTHYHDDALMARHPAVAARFRGTEPSVFEGYAHVRHPHWYQAARFAPGFCGSSATHPRWLSRDAIIDALRFFGHDVRAVGLDQPDHPHGPAFGLVSTRRAHSDA